MLAPWIDNFSGESSADRSILSALGLWWWCQWGLGSSGDAMVAPLISTSHREELHGQDKLLLDQAASRFKRLDVCDVGHNRCSAGSW